MPSEIQSNEVKWGTRTFKGQRLHVPEQNQTLQRIGVGGELERLTQEGRQTAWLADYSGGNNPDGMLSAPGILDWRTALSNPWFNEGLQCRTGTPVLPYKITNQTSVTDDEDISGGVAAGWRVFEVKTSLGDTEERYYRAEGHTIKRNVGNGDSSLEVAYTTTDQITGMCLHNVNGSLKLCVYTHGATDDVFYVADPTGTWSGNLTTLIALSAGDWLTPLGRGYFPTIGTGVNACVGEIGGTSGVWWIDTATAAPWTMQSLVESDGKDLLGNVAAVTSSAQAVTSGSTLPASGSDPGGVGTSIAARIWATPGNITADDANYATVGATIQTNDSVLTDYLYGSGCDFSAVPLAARITGIQISIKLKLASANNTTAYWADVTPLINGSASGINHADGAAISTTEGTVTFGATTDNWQLNNLTGADIQNMGVRLQFLFRNTSSGVSNTISVNYITVTVSYQETGTMISLTTGGYAVAHNPVTPHRAVMVMPRANDEAAILQPREMWFVDLAWDTATERPIMSLSQPNEGMEYVWGCYPAMGGWAIFGGAKAGDRGIHLKLLDTQGNLSNFNFPGVHGANTVSINMCYAVSSTWLLLGVQNTDYTDFQWWWYNNGKYHADFLLQSKSDLAIAAQSLPVGTGELNTQDGRVYMTFPNTVSATQRTAVARTFFPPNPSQDPRSVNLTEVRSMAYSGAAGSRTEDTPLRLISNELNFGPEEANKVLLSLGYYSRHVNTAGANTYGSVTIDFVTDNDTTCATPEVTKAL